MLMCCSEYNSLTLHFLWMKDRLSIIKPHLLNKLSLSLFSLLKHIQDRKISSLEQETFSLQ